MNIHEHQAKDVLRQFGVPLPTGVAVFSLDEAKRAIDSLPGPLWVVKSQIHAGGRGKGKFIEKDAGEKGGVRLGFSKEQALEHVKAMLGKHLVTKQTGPGGKQVNRIYIEDGADIAKELYLSLLVDRAVGRVAFVASTEGGMDIEQVAHDTPEKIITLAIDPSTGVTDADAASSAMRSSSKDQARTDMLGLAKTLYKAFVEKDMSMLEINPLIVMKNGRVRVLDAKVSFDDNALFRHPDIEALADKTEQDPEGNRGQGVGPRLHRPRRHDRLHGQRRGPRHGDHGHHQALRRGARQLLRRRRRRRQGESHGRLQDHHEGPQGEGHPREHLRRHHEVRCHRRGRARRGASETNLTVPLVVRLEGTNVEKGKKIIKDSGLNVISANDLDDAAQKIVAAVKGRK